MSAWGCVCVSLLKYMKELILVFSLAVIKTLTKATYRRKVYFGLWFQKDESPSWLGSLAAGAGSWGFITLLANTKQRGPTERRVRLWTLKPTPSDTVPPPNAVPLPKHCHKLVTVFKYLSPGRAFHIQTAIALCLTDLEGKKCLNLDFSVRFTS